MQHEIIQRPSKHGFSSNNRSLHIDMAKRNVISFNLELLKIKGDNRMRIQRLYCSNEMTTNNNEMEQDLFNYCLDHKLNDILAKRTQLEIQRASAKDEGNRDQIRGIDYSLKNIDLELSRLCNNATIGQHIDVKT